jgi:hypothetical protein
MKTIFDPNYIDFLQLLKKNNVKYVMVGGLAVQNGYYEQLMNLALIILRFRLMT